MNLGQYAREVERIVAGSVPVKKLCRVDSELIIPEEIIDMVKEVLK